MKIFKVLFVLVCLIVLLPIRIPAANVNITNITTATTLVSADKIIVLSGSGNVVLSQLAYTNLLTVLNATFPFTTEMMSLSNNLGSVVISLSNNIPAMIASSNLVSTGQLYSISATAPVTFTTNGSDVAISIPAYQATNAALTRFIANQYANNVISPAPASGTTNFWLDFAYASQTITPTCHVSFYYATNGTASATINNFTDITVYNDQTTNIEVTFSASFKYLGVVSNVVLPGKHLQIAFMWKRSTDQTNVTYATAHSN